MATLRHRLLGLKFMAGQQRIFLQENRHCCSSLPPAKQGSRLELELDVICTCFQQACDTSLSSERVTAGKSCLLTTYFVELSL